MYPALHDDLSVTNTLQKLSIREQSLWLSVTAFLYAFCITKRNFFTAFYIVRKTAQRFESHTALYPVIPLTFIVHGV